MKPIIYDLTKAEDINDYYRSYLTGDPVKDQPVLGWMRERNRHRTVKELAAMMSASVKPGPSYTPKS